MAIQPLDVRLATLAAVPLAVVRRQVSRATLTSAVREGCGLAWAFARERHLPVGRNVAVYWDGSIRLEAGVELAEPFEEQNGVVRSATPAGPTASVTLIGPYEQLGLAHAAVRDWCTSNGHRLAGPNWEIYGHWQTEWNIDPSKIRTEVHYQVAAAGGHMSTAPFAPAGDRSPIAFDAIDLAASLTVADLPASLRWYRDVIGFAVDQEYAREGVVRAVALRAGAVRVLLTQDNGAKGESRTKGEGFSLQFTTRQSVDALAAGIVERGGVLATEPADAFGARVFRVRDADGFLLVISSERATS